MKRQVFLCYILFYALLSAVCSTAGRIDTLSYKVNKDGKVLDKQALVYLPEGYDGADQSKRYNVLYLAHGGNDNPGSFFSNERTPRPLDEVAQSLVEQGEMDPIIIVSATYYPPKTDDAPVGMQATIDDCQDFNKEVRNCLIPAVGKKYNTYLDSYDDGSITATRNHRAYGGFSMGALSTWYQLAYDPDAFATYIPLSGDLWVYDAEGNKQDAATAADWLNSKLSKTPWQGNEIRILAYSGTKDIAYEPQFNFIKSLKCTPKFSFENDTTPGNLYFNVTPNGIHTYEFISQYLEDAMPKIWKKKRTSPYWLGADISGTPMSESFGTTFFNKDGEPRENTALMKELGMNAVRLRVWVNPKGGHSSKEEVLEMARRAKENDMEIMLSFHYSDTWSDPGSQPIPEAWENYNYSQLKKAVANHTKETLQLLKNNGIDIKWVQLGNETTHGMLWDMGKAESNMEQYAGLTDAAYKAVKKEYPNATCIVHLDCGADIVRYHKIFDGLNKYGVPYDMIGMSVYPYWDLKAGRTSNHNETADNVTANIKTLSKEYGKPFMIVETGYEAARPNEGYAFMRSLIDKTYPLEECHGIFYWAPELEKFYPLGAFENERPTKILDAFTEAAFGTAAQDTTFYSICNLDCRAPSGVIKGRLLMPLYSEYNHGGKTPVVVMSHGFNGTYLEPLKYAECLARHGVAAYVFDYCNGSRSSASGGSILFMSVPGQKEDLEAISQRLGNLPYLDSSRMFLLGCSQGALVSTLAAGANPEYYKGLILIYPALGIPETADNMLESSKDSPEEIDLWGVKLSQRYYRSIKGIDPYLALGTNKSPLLMVYGEDDAISPASMVEKVKSTVPDARIEKIEKGKHGFPNLFNHRLSETHVLTFIKDILSK